MWRGQKTVSSSQSGARASKRMWYIREINAAVICKDRLATVKQAAIYMAGSLGAQ